jgi:HEAT repeat protein
MSGAQRRVWIVLAPLLAFAFSCSAPPNPDRLIADLKADRWQVRASAAESLGDVGGTRAIAPLREALADDSPEVRASAVMSLGRLGAREALDDVRALIQAEKDREVLVQSIFALAALAPEVNPQRDLDVNILVDRVTDERRHVSSAAGETSGEPDC